MPLMSLRGAQRQSNLKPQQGRLLRCARHHMFRAFVLVSNFELRISNFVPRLASAPHDTARHLQTHHDHFRPLFPGSYGSMYGNSTSASTKIPHFPKKFFCPRGHRGPQRGLQPQPKPQEPKETKKGERKKEQEAGQTHQVAPFFRLLSFLAALLSRLLPIFLAEKTRSCGLAVQRKANNRCVHPQ